MDKSILESMGAYDKLIKRDDVNDDTVPFDDAGETEPNDDIHYRCMRNAFELRFIAERDLYKCPGCGDWAAATDGDYDDYAHSLTHWCGTEFELYNVAPLDMWDFMATVIECTYYANGRGRDDYAGVRLLVDKGDVNVYVDTHRGTVEAYYKNEWSCVELWPAAREELDDNYYELWTEEIE